MQNVDYERVNENAYPWVSFWEFHFCTISLHSEWSTSFSESMKFVKECSVLSLKPQAKNIFRLQMQNFVVENLNAQILYFWKNFGKKYFKVASKIHQKFYFHKILSILNVFNDRKVLNCNNFSLNFPIWYL